PPANFSFPATAAAITMRRQSLLCWASSVTPRFGRPSSALRSPRAFSPRLLPAPSPRPFSPPLPPAPSPPPFSPPPLPPPSPPPLPPPLSPLPSPSRLLLPLSPFLFHITLFFLSPS